jgi:Outer membrane protein beta-barrel family/Carboxypeptidase regulatory-like domain
LSRCIIVLFIGLLAKYELYAQNDHAAIKGIVTDSLTGEILDKASVKIFHSTNASVIGQTTSTIKGFSLQPVPKGHYQLIVSYVGYKPDTLLINLTGTTRVYNVGKIYLSKKAGTLTEVFIKAVKPAVSIKNDTVIYNAQAFQTHPYASIEDLLKKLPGISVDGSGNIFFQNKKVNRIYIDGKEILFNDLSTLTRNLRADMVMQIEAFTIADPGPALPGLDDEKPRAINLRLKNDKKRGLLGNGQLASGTAGRYAIGGSLNAIGDGRVIISTLSRMNVGDGYSVARGKWSPANSSAKQRFSDLQLNYSDNWNSAITASGSVFTGSRQISSAEHVSRQTFLSDSLLQENRGSVYDQSFISNRFNSQFNFKLDSMNSLVYMSAAAIDKSSSLSNGATDIKISSPANSYLQGHALTNNNWTNKYHFFQNQLSYERRFKKNGRSLRGYMQCLSDNQVQTNETKSSLAFYNVAGELTGHQDISWRSVGETRARNFNTGMIYIEPLVKNKSLRLSADFSSREKEADKKTFTYNALTHQYDQSDSAATNWFNNRVIEQRLGIDFISGGKPVYFEMGMEGLLSQVKNKNYTWKTNIGRQQVNHIPHAIIGYKLNKGNTINLSYRGSTAQPTIEQLQPVQDTRNPFLILTGNPQLGQQFTHQLSLQLTRFKPKTFQFFTAGLSGYLTARKIIPYSIYAGQGIQQLQFVNAPHPVYNLQGQVDYVFQFGEKKKNKIDIGNTVTYGRDLSFVNAEQNRLKQFSLQPKIEINYSLGNLTLEINGGLQYSCLHYSLAPGSKTILLTQNYAAELDYEFPFSFLFSTNSRFWITESGALPRQNNIEWNMFLSKRILKKQALEIRLSGFNLLNANSNFIQIVGENFIETRSMQTMNRLFLASLLYNFDSFRRMVKRPSDK